MRERMRMKEGEGITGEDEVENEGEGMMGERYLITT